VAEKALPIEGQARIRLEPRQTLQAPEEVDGQIVVLAPGRDRGRKLGYHRVLLPVASPEPPSVGSGLGFNPNVGKAA
jgi:hypothetical protein